MIDKSLVEAILQGLDTMSGESNESISNDRFRYLGDDKVILEHLQYMKQKGFIEGKETQMGRVDKLIRMAQIQLTSAGHDILLRSITQPTQMPVPGPVAVLQSATSIERPESESKDQPGSRTAESAQPTAIFLSHSSHDVGIATALITLLRGALPVSAQGIRCTSVEGHRLPAGATTDDQLRLEVRESNVFIGLLTPVSLKSSYVLFELGARWGAELRLIPLLAAGAQPGILPGPLSGVNVLSCDVPEQLHQLVHDVAELLSVQPERPAVYQKYINELVHASNAAARLKLETAGAPIGIEKGQKSTPEFEYAGCKFITRPVNRKDHYIVDAERSVYHSYEIESTIILAHFYYTPMPDSYPFLNVRAKVFLVDGEGHPIQSVFDGVWYLEKSKSRRFSAGDAGAVVVALVPTGLKGLWTYEHHLKRHERPMNWEYLAPNVQSVKGTEHFVSVELIAKWGEEVVTTKGFDFSLSLDPEPKFEPIPGEET